MLYQSLLLIFMILYPMQNSFHFKQKNKLKLLVNELEYSKLNYSLYQGITTGNSQKIPRKLKKKIKQYGFIHLLTPSGLHLSSLLPILRIHSIIRFMSLIIILVLLRTYDGYDSLIRVTLFQLVSMKIKHVPFVFILSLFLSILMGQYRINPLSFNYSLLFWGTVILFRKNYLKLLFFMNISMYFANGITGELASPLSLIVNPLMTSLTTLFFPLLVLNNFMPQFLEFNSLLNFFFDSWIYIFEFFQRIDTFPKLYFTPVFLIFFLFALQQKSKILLIFILSTACFNTPLKIKTYLPSELISTSQLGSFKKTRGNKFYYSKGYCLNNQDRFYCKKKASHK